MDLEEFENTGRIWFRQALSDSALMTLDASANLAARAGSRLGLTPELREVLAGEGGLGAIMSRFGKGLVPARVVAFNKTSKTN